MRWRGDREETDFELVVGFRIRFVRLVQFPDFPALKFKVAFSDIHSFVDHCRDGEYPSAGRREGMGLTGELGGSFAMEVGILSFEESNALYRTP